MNVKQLLTLLTMLALLTTGIAVADEISTPSDFTINTMLSVTLTPCGNPLSFGANDQNTNATITCQVKNGAPAVLVENDAVSNADCQMSTKITDFTGPEGIYSYGYFGYSGNYGTTYNQYGLTYQEVNGAIAPGASSGVHINVQLESDMSPGQYNGTIYVQAVGVE